jgi:hypothetical protein
LDVRKLTKTSPSQVKRTDELSRKMRFFTDQVEKSEVITGARTGATENLKLDELEVGLTTPLCILGETWI